MSVLEDTQTLKDDSRCMLSLAPAIGVVAVRRFLVALPLCATLFNLPLARAAGHAAKAELCKWNRTLVQPRATYRTHLRAEALLLHGDGSAPWDWLPPCLCDGLSIAVLCCAAQRPYAREAAGCAVVLASPFLCDPTLEPLRDVHSVASSAPVCSKDCRKQCSRKPYRPSL